jgi:integrase
LKLVGGLPEMIAACRYYSARHKRTTAKLVSAVAAELQEVKKARGASKRYQDDLKSRLTRFAKACSKHACDVTTSDCQAWFDAQKFAPQSYTNYRRVLHLLFEFAKARNYASDNPVEGVERVKVRNGGAITIYKPAELARLLSAASDDFLPCIALGAFAGLRSAEIERLEWNDIDLTGRHIVIGANAAKTASRRVVPVCDALADWLGDYAKRTGRVWKGTHDEFYDEQQVTASATAVEADSKNGISAKPALKWKTNALRHSFASYRFAKLGDAGRVAAELGNSAAVVHRHYRELVKPAEAAKWFGVKPKRAANIISISAAATANS